MKASRLALGISLVCSLSTNAFAQDNPFDAVFAIMTQDQGLDSPGCRGCHIVEDPSMAIGPFFGNTQDEVECGLINLEDGQVIAGGRDSLLAYYLREGIMPYAGAQWADDQLELLYTWLDAVAPPSP
jgi:hypothetical protein